MKRTRLLPVAAVLVALASATPGAPAKETPPLRLTIAFTGDVSGYLEPCG